MKKVVIIDYGMGNLHSVKKGMEKVGVPVTVSSKPTAIKNSIAIVLPGVGAFGDAMKEIKKRKLYNVIKKEVEAGKPILGICLGMQILLSESSEHGRNYGFGFIKGKARKFSEKGLKVPHMGWNEVKAAKKNVSILKSIDDGSYAYFVHSYYAVTKDPAHILMKTKYGKTVFASALHRDNIFGFQFHPEKSGEKMLKIYKNFYSIAKKAEKGS